ncbi:MAG: fibronectin type III domain-containing protein [Christiangramia sp.]|uniref:fibronectin type III domain-containing protein n=1 Tax=Christiangramia sp. TaxID=1931228 RepID=UPI00324299A5
MRRIIILLIALFLIVSCTTDPDTPPDVSQENKPPSVPKLNSPEANLFCTDNELDFKWSASTDPDGDPVTYQIQVSNDSDFSNMYYTDEVSTTNSNQVLEKGKNYYWHVRAKDDKGNFSAYSEMRNLYTEGESVTNSLPAIPELINPTQNVVSRSEVNLKWKTSDADDDILTYDLYFGTSNNPELYKENLADPSYILTNLQSDTSYFWRITVKDSKGGVTVGQIWTFKTN